MNDKVCIEVSHVNLDRIIEALCKQLDEYKSLLKYHMDENARLRREIEEMKEAGKHE